MKGKLKYIFLHIIYREYSKFCCCFLLCCAQDHHFFLAMPSVQQGGGKAILSVGSKLKKGFTGLFLQNCYFVSRPFSPQKSNDD